MGSLLTRHFNRSCATGFNYFCKYVVLLANNLTASGLIMQYWLPHINVGVWVITFAVPIICINVGFPVIVLAFIKLDMSDLTVDPSL